MRRIASLLLQYMTDDNSALYPRGDPYETSDPVFGVKESLMVDFSTVTDPKIAARFDAPQGMHLLTHDFVLLTESEARELRKNKAIEAMEKQSRNVVFVKDLPVPAE